MEPYIEPQQRSGYLKFVAMLLVVTILVPAMWGMVIGFLGVMVVGGIPIFIARWLVDKYFEVNRDSAKVADEGDGDEASGDGVPWYADYRRDGRVRRN